MVPPRTLITEKPSALNSQTGIYDPTAPPSVAAKVILPLFISLILAPRRSAV